MNSAKRVSHLLCPYLWYAMGSIGTPCPVFYDPSLVLNCVGGFKLPCATIWSWDHTHSLLSRPRCLIHSTHCQAPDKSCSCLVIKIEQQMHSKLHSLEELVFYRTWGQYGLTFWVLFRALLWCWPESSSSKIAKSEIQKGRTLLSQEQCQSFHTQLNQPCNYTCKEIRFKLK